jgi:hypothetical protein
MATSLIAKPQPITPAYNPIKFIYDSTNNNETGFRYIFDIYDSSATKIAEYRVLPNLDGYGEVDLSKLLQSYVSYDFDETTTGADPANCYFEYDVNVGEEYVASYDWTNNLTDNGGYVKIPITSHPFSVGDQVVITPDTPVSNPLLEGLFTVTEVNANDFTVNSLWSGIGDATDDGSVKFADNRKSVTRDIVTSTGNYVFNGALPFKDFPSYTDDDYILDDSSALFVTSIPQSTFYITPEQDVWLNLMIKGNSLGRIAFENDGGDIAYRLATQTDLLSQQLVAGDLSGLTVTSGSLPIVKSDTVYYDVHYFETSTKSVTYRFYIDRRCKINDYEIAFLDRMGSIGSFAFQLRDKLTGTVKKEVYNQNIDGSVVSSEWTYDLTAQGKRVVYPTIEETYELQTNWMNEDMASYFTELVSSPQTWMKIDDTYYSCVVTDTGYEKERQRNRNLIRKSIKVQLSVQDRVNG